jgi:hypothetical protein
LNVGSGLLAGGTDSTAELVEVIDSLNYSGVTANSIMAIAQNAKSRNEGRRLNNESAGERLTFEELEARYGEARRFTTGTVFGCGDGYLGKAVLEEVIKRNTARKAKAEAVSVRRKELLRKLIKAVRAIRKESKQPKFRMTNAKLTTLCRYKKTKEDGKIPTKKADLEQLWKKIQHRSSPTVSPSNSDDESEGSEEDLEEANFDELSEPEEEESGDEQEEEGSDEEDGQLMFGGSDSEGEGSDKDEEESSDEE